MRRIPAAVLAAVCLFLQACNQPFQPDGAYNGRLALYALLSATSDTQFVRIARTYQGAPSGDVTDAVVDIVPGNGAPTIHMRDTTVIHYGPSGNAGTYNVYVAYNFRPQPYVTYQVFAASPEGGDVHGSTVTLGQAEAGIVNPSALTASPDSVVLTADFVSSTGAYVLQLFVEYDLTINGITTRKKTEVPGGTSADATGKITLQYPAFTPVPPASVFNGFTTVYTWFPQALYVQTQSEIAAANPPGSVRFTGVIFTVTQIDQALYDYYYVLHGPKDVSTIRLDEPDFTNVTNGLGVIASTQMVVHEVLLGQ